MKAFARKEIQTATNKEIEVQTVLLLHLSDIHFRRGEVETPMDPNRHLRNELLLDAEKMCQKIKKTPSAILISGDIAYEAHVDEYDFALKWLEELAEKCGTNIENVFIVPGNHDVDRSIASRESVQGYHRDIKSTTNSVALDGKLRKLLADPDVSRILYKPLDQFNFFAQQFFCSVSAPLGTIATRNLKLNDGSVLRLTGLNSAFVSSKTDEKGTLFADPACFQIKRENGVAHLAVIHHPFTWIRNGEALRDHLDDVACIQLFGHDHTSRIDLKRDSVHIFASAAHPDRSEHGWEPGYNLIEVEVIRTGSERKLNIGTHVRIWQSNPGMFRPKMDRRENDVFRHEIILDEWISSPIETEVLVPAIDPNLSECTLPAQESQEVGGDPMDTLRGISIRFFKLTLSQKVAIAGKLGLLEDEDLNQPDFERFRRVFLRARERGLIEAMDIEIVNATAIEKK